MEVKDFNLEDLKIDYKAEFVPFSQSRNKDNKDKSLNWTVTLKRNNVTLITDYMQGIANHVDYKKYQKPMYGGCTIYQAEQYEQMIEQSSETGKRYTWFNSMDKAMAYLGKLKGLPIPSLKDVLYSLILDSNVLQHDSFESWAPDFGYEEDSRQAEKIYQACLKIALKVNQMFSTEELEDLQEFYQDF